MTGKSSLFSLAAAAGWLWLLSHVELHVSLLCFPQMYFLTTILSFSTVSGAGKVSEYVSEYLFECERSRATSQQDRICDKEENQTAGQPERTRGPRHTHSQPSHFLILVSVLYKVATKRYGNKKQCFHDIRRCYFDLHSFPGDF